MFPKIPVILSDAKHREGSSAEILHLIPAFERKHQAQNDDRACRPCHPKGFTLIELVMIILITSVLSMAGYHIMRFVVRNSFYLPNQVQADLVAAEALELIVEGDGAAHGLRFCKTVSTATATQVQVTNRNVLDNTVDQIIIYDLTGGVLTRKIDSGAPTPIPYFMATDMVISGAGTGGALFTYYDASENPLTQPISVANVANIRRINIDLRAQNGTGSSDKYEGTSQQSTSVRVYNV